MESIGIWPASENSLRFCAADTYPRPPSMVSSRSNFALSFRVARADGRLRLDVDHEAVEVGALTGTRGLHAVGDLEDRRVDGVDRDLARLRELAAVLRRRHVAAATLDGELEVELRLVVERRD